MHEESQPQPQHEPPAIEPAPAGRGFGRLLWREWVRPFILILVVMGTFRSAVADWNHVPTGSMKPTILVGDRIFVNKLAYDLRVPFTRLRLATWSEPARGDLVVFFSPADGKRLVKRVVGLPGDRVAMEENRLTVNGEPVTYEPLDSRIISELDDDDRRGRAFRQEQLGDHAHPVMWASLRPSRDTFAEIEVAGDHYFVMGDNRDESFDSRWFGVVPGQLIVGRATGVAISVDPDRYDLPRWNRFFSGLP
ncbi:MAG: signal peptidase I [Thermoanaerobaculia bacterium]|nr:signal peptidase I [Thermoanaerobaculia bacterium]